MNRKTDEDTDGFNPDQKRFLREDELALRWHMSRRTLQRRRLAGHGPDYLTIGRRILYPREAVEHYEARRLRPGSDE